MNRLTVVRITFLAATFFILVATSRINKSPTSAVDEQWFGVSGDCAPPIQLLMTRGPNCFMVLDGGLGVGIPHNGYQCSELSIRSQSSMSLSGIIRAVDGGLWPLPDGGVRAGPGIFESNGTVNDFEVFRSCSGDNDAGVFVLPCVDRLFLSGAAAEPACTLVLTPRPSSTLTRCFRRKIAGHRVRLSDTLNLTDL